MAMPPNPTPENSRWLSDFHHTHGMDSEAERSFTGYLMTRGWHPFALSPAALDQAWAGFLAYVETSRQA